MSRKSSKKLENDFIGQAFQKTRNFSLLGAQKVKNVVVRRKHNVTHLLTGKQVTLFTTLALISWDRCRSQTGTVYFFSSATISLNGTELSRFPINRQKPPQLRCLNIGSADLDIYTAPIVTKDAILNQSCSRTFSLP